MDRGIGPRLKLRTAVCPLFPKIARGNPQNGKASRFKPEESVPVKAVAGLIVALLVVCLVGDWQQQLAADESDRYEESMAELVALYGGGLSNNVNLSITMIEGRLDINFVDDTNLIFWKNAYEWSPHPSGVNQSGDLLDGYCLYFGAAYASVMLGSGYNYTIFIHGSKGHVDVGFFAGGNAHLGNVTIDADGYGGDIDFELTKEASIADNITITLAGGNIDVDVTLPYGTSGKFNIGYRMFSYTEGITVNPGPEWSEAYTCGSLTRDYGTTSTSVTINCACECGAITADLD